ncbi:hypothetical protein P154DRAFT_619388 [Amniculicola lignicola CBS 123094]|uniref:Rhodopsin domain-containing protein n=1 Tax=Amniculicola lignicola CBS 123094 TaxID=1392246 RepID=A0A6A5WHQ4_9PLEO|nr:hypothetical protein P154DRAFT_619388 [Amniculicola lignicola CBS 123094]
MIPNRFLVGSLTIDLSELDLTDRRSNVASVRIANIILITLVGLIVGLRLFVRAYLLRKIFIDDVLIIIATIFTLVLSSVCLAATNHGLGTHVWLLGVAEIFATVKRCVQFLYVCQVFYACAIAFTKLSIIASYLRFVHDRFFRLTMFLTGLIVIGLWLTGIFVVIFQCSPVSGAWDFENPDRKCIDFIEYLYASSVISVAIDVVLCILPCPYLWKLKMPLKQRIILCLLFGIGLVACVAGIVRITKLDTLIALDVTFGSVLCLNLSVVECSLGIVCVSIPALRPLAGKIFPKAFRSNVSNHSSEKTPIAMGVQRSAAASIAPESRPESRPESNIIDSQEDPSKEYGYIRQDVEIDISYEERG